MSKSGSVQQQNTTRINYEFEKSPKSGRDIQLPSLWENRRSPVVAADANGPANHSSKTGATALAKSIGEYWAKRGVNDYRFRLKRATRVEYRKTEDGKTVEKEQLYHSIEDNLRLTRVPGGWRMIAV